MAIDTTKKVTNIKVDGVSMPLAGGGTSKLPSVIDGSIEVLNEEDFGDATKIIHGMFSMFIKLKEVHIPETVKIVEDDAFHNMSYASGSEGPEVYYNGTFERVGENFGSVSIDDEKTGITYYKLNDNPYAIFNRGYVGDEGIEININENCEYIAACSVLPSVTSINIPQNVKTISRIYGQGITNLVFPDNVQYINIIEAESLTTVTFGSGLKHIENYCFVNARNITSITYNGTVEQWNKIELPAAWGFTQEIDVVCLDGTAKINAPD